MENNIYVTLHADDFGLSDNVSDVVLCCITEGAVRSVAVMTNMSAAERSVKKLLAARLPVKVSVHLNLVEGRCAADAGQLPLLTDENGFLCCSWGKLLALSFLRRGELKREVKLEFAAQTQLLLAWLPQGWTPRFDSHQHTHMIPAIADALCELIAEKGWKPEYVRLVSEQPGPVLGAAAVKGTVAPINRVKNALLNLFAPHLRKKLDAAGIGYSEFFGVLLTGDMDPKRVISALPRVTAASRRPSLEILIHPGRLLPDELTEEFNRPSFNEMHTAKGRLDEQETAKKLVELIG